MAEIVNKGELSVTGTIICTPTIPGKSVKLLNIRFNNPLAYTLKLEVYNQNTLSTQTIYDLSLDAGDTVTDNFTYVLKYQDNQNLYFFHIQLHKHHIQKLEQNFHQSLDLSKNII